MQIFLKFTNNFGIYIVIFTNQGRTYCTCKRAWPDRRGCMQHPQCPAVLKRIRGEIFVYFFLLQPRQLLDSGYSR